jgi:hypothetical protein
MAAADVAMWLAIMTRLGTRDGSVTAAMTSRRSWTCRAPRALSLHARVVKLGGRLVYGLAETITTDGRLLTHHTLTYARPSERTTRRKQLNTLGGTGPRRREGPSCEAAPEGGTRAVLRVR